MIQKRNIDWQKLYEDGTYILVHGKIAFCIWQKFFNEECRYGYGCGRIQSFSNKEVTLESEQGEITFIIDDIKGVTVLGLESVNLDQDL